MRILRRWYVDEVRGAMLEEDGRGPYLVVVVGWRVSLAYDNDVSTRPSALIGTTERLIIIPYRDGPHQGVSVLLRLHAPQTLVVLHRSRGGDALRHTIIVIVPYRIVPMVLYQIIRTELLGVRERQILKFPSEQNDRGANKKSTDPLKILSSSLAQL